MPATLRQPGVYIEEISSGVRTITGVATSIGLFIGWAPRGAVDRAVRLSSFSDFEREYGGLDRRSMLGFGVKQFFENGGSDAYVIRLVGAGNVTASVPITANLTVSASSPGTWANIYRIRTTRRPAPDAGRFRIDVLDSTNADAVVESFENLSMSDADPRFPPNVINGIGRSRIIHVTATNAAAAPADGTIDIDTGAGATAGVDGSVLTPNSADFHTALLACFGVGSIADRIDLFNIVCVPGETDATTLTTLQGHCKTRRAFLIVDADSAATVASLNAGATGLTQSDAMNSAIYFPWVRAPNPLMQGALTDFPPCGYVAGVYARTDATRGVWKAPAGSDASINGAASLAITMSDAENGQLNPLGINCLRTLPVYGNVVWGSRTLHGQNDRGSEWKYVPVRRMALFLEESLYRGTQWVVFEPNDEPLWAQIRLNIGAFLQGLFRQGAFQGRSPREAYFVKCDRETTTQADINLGIVNIFVGFAPLKPAEFVVIKIQQIAGDIPT
jgi:phage tail sheath protein FI